MILYSGMTDEKGFPVTPTGTAPSDWMHPGVAMWPITSRRRDFPDEPNPWPGSFLAQHSPTVADMERIALAAQDDVPFDPQFGYRRPWSIARGALVVLDFEGFKCANDPATLLTLCRAFRNAAPGVRFAITGQYVPLADNANLLIASVLAGRSYGGVRLSSIEEYAALHWYQKIFPVAELTDVWICGTYFCEPASWERDKAFVVATRRIWETRLRSKPLICPVSTRYVFGDKAPVPTDTLRAWFRHLEQVGYSGAWLWGDPTAEVVAAL